MSHDEEQEQPRREYYHHPRRTFDDRKSHTHIRSRPESVTILLVGLAIWNIFLIFILSTSMDILVEQAGFNNAEVIEVAAYFQIGLCLIAIFGVIGVWHWKKRGYQTLISSYAFASFISLCSINIAGLIVNGVITFLIYRIVSDLDPLMD